MSRKNHIAVVACQLVFLVTVSLLFGSPAGAQDFPSWWGSSAWFDWSDFRAEVGGRVFLARLVSGNVSWITRGRRGRNGEVVPSALVDYDLTQGIFAASSDPEPFREFWAALYFDRVGFRYHDELRRITRRGLPLDPPNTQVWRLDASGSRIGIDLDLLRYPFFKFGINADWNVEPVRFVEVDPLRNQAVNDDPNSRFVSYEPITLGFHARAIPFRIREVPLTITARARFPMPFLNRNPEARVTDWEIGGGLRPAVWETSFIGLSTFSVGVEAGFRGFYLNFTEDHRDFQLKANWQGAFFRVGAYF